MWPTALQVQQKESSTQIKQHKLQKTPSSNVSYKKYHEDLISFISRPNSKSAIKRMLPAPSFLTHY